MMDGMVRLELDTYAGPSTVFTEEAAAGMVGQRVPIQWQPTPRSIFDELPERRAVLATVVAARVINEGQAVRLTVEYDEA